MLLPVHRTGVRSSSIVSIGYDEERSVLEVEFVGGDVYRYYDVPAGVVETLLAAPSLGKTFNAWIRDRYRHERVD